MPVQEVKQIKSEMESGQVMNGLVLDIDPSLRTIKTYPKHGQLNQRWKFVPYNYLFSQTNNCKFQPVIYCVTLSTKKSMQTTTLLVATIIAIIVCVQSTRTRGLPVPNCGKVGGNYAVAGV